jgi:hypothetical protein
MIDDESSALDEQLLEYLLKCKAPQAGTKRHWACGTASGETRSPKPQLPSPPAVALSLSLPLSRALSLAPFLSVSHLFLLE